MISRRTWLLSLAATPLVLAACGDGTDPATAPASTSSASGGTAVDTSPAQKGRITVEAVPEIAAKVPQAIKDRGTLVIGTTGNGAPPLSFKADDDKTVIGIEPDIALLVAGVLGLEPDIQATSWENLFLSMDSGQYDVGFSNITVTEERKEKYDFASYRVDTLAWEVAKDSTITSIEEPKDIAGLTVSVGSGTNQEKVLLNWNEQLKAAGEKEATIQYYQQASDTYLALKSGRIVANFGPNPTAAYHALVSGDTKIVGTVPGGGTIVADIAATTKKDNGLVQALADALNHLISSGAYGKTLERWNLADEAVKTSEINPPGLPKTD
ncbi:ABC transporter substrate-binding protein [Kineococcus rhizosphaerae]|uniref:Amino acid ABC transporter substrate-binding protein (PAAT family) n=1 Tax=Kineococcus rhizosphaerae TaxID=559628 RepID=A0A2T0QXY1_9ACTN|nr:ABC transporter substrate-binding protein [Kineococcus rhizosphaerae]PRY11056.1 amino acid ABC transporter substrate-binding protein (PAAT family) [Kineococcus rhizosphaerae]